MRLIDKAVKGSFVLILVLCAPATVLAEELARVATVLFVSGGAEAE